MAGSFTSYFHLHIYASFAYFTILAEMKIKIFCQAGSKIYRIWRILVLKMFKSGKEREYGQNDILSL